MGQYDLHDNIKIVRSISPVAGAATGKIVDRAGYAGVEVEISWGSVTATAATCTPVIKDGDVTGTMTSVADTYLLGTEANAALAATTPRTSGTSKNVTKRVGYIGTKRYISCNTLQTTTAAAPNGVNIILSNPISAPVAT